MQSFPIPFHRLDSKPDVAFQGIYYENNLALHRNFRNKKPDTEKNTAAAIN